LLAGGLCGRRGNFACRALRCGHSAARSRTLNRHQRPDGSGQRARPLHCRGLALASIRDRDRPNPPHV
jgi:hypothetical protein